MKEIEIANKKIDIFLILVLIVGIAVFITEAYFVSQIKFIGSSDPAFYAEVADNLIKGKGFVMDFINSYFVKFQSITHPEEYGFPGVSLILIPFLLLFGKTAFAVKLPSMIAGVFLLPILTYYLGKDFFNQRIGFLAAVSIIFYPTIFPISFGGERDILYAFFLVAGIYFFYKGTKEEEIKTELLNAAPLIKFLKENKYFLLMGAFLGYSYLIRQTTLAFIPVLIVAYYLMNKRFSKKFFFGLGVCALIMAPWLIRNYLAFGDPFFTVNKYVGWIVGYSGYAEAGIFKVYWNNIKPGPTLLINIYGSAKAFILTFFIKSFGNLLTQFKQLAVINILAFLGLALAGGQAISKRLSKWICYLVIFSFVSFLITNFIKIGSVPESQLHILILYNLLLSLPYIFILLTSIFLFAKYNCENTIFSLLWISVAFFFSIIWVFDIRYWLLIIPFLFIYTWFALEKILCKINDVILKKSYKLEHIRKFLLILLAIFILFSLPQTFGKFLDKDALFPYQDDVKSKDRLYLAEKVGNMTEKGVVIMGCDIGVFHFYNGRKYVTFPSDRAAVVFNMARAYNVSYFTLLGCDRRAIDAEFYLYLFGNKNIAEENYTREAYQHLVSYYASSDGTNKTIDLPVWYEKLDIPSKYLLEVYPSSK